MQDEESGEKRILDLPRNTTAVAVRAASNTPLPESGMEQWDSMNLISASTNHLFGLMKGLNPKDPSEIMTACECAKGIQGMMRLQLDAWKCKKGMK